MDIPYESEQEYQLANERRHDGTFNSGFDVDVKDIECEYSNGRLNVSWKEEHTGQTLESAGPFLVEVVVEPAHTDDSYSGKTCRNGRLERRNRQLEGYCAVTMPCPAGGALVRILAPPYEAPVTTFFLKD